MPDMRQTHRPLGSRLSAGFSTRHLNAAPILMSTGTLEKNGDGFERGEASWIRRRLPRYESVWQKFIGNDGSNTPLPLDGLTDEQSEARRLFYQSHYSLAVYSYLFDQHTTEALASLQASVQSRSHRNVVTHLRDMKDLTTYVALLGQACDMVETIAKALKDQEIADKIQPIFSQRNNSIHAARIPVRYDPYGVLIPPISRRDNDGGWEKFRLWGAVETAEFNYLEDWMSSLRNEYFATLANPLSPMIAKAAEKRFGREIVWHVTFTPTSTLTPGLSSSNTPQKSPRRDQQDGLWIPPSGDGRISGDSRIP